MLTGADVAADLQRQALDKLVADTLDRDGTAATAFAAVLERRTAQLTAMRRTLNAQARAASKSASTRLRREIVRRAAAVASDGRSRYFLNKPFLIWADGDLAIQDTIAPNASAAKFRIDTRSSAYGHVTFHYLWTNDTDQAVSVDFNGYLIANGYVEIESDGGYLPGTRDANANLTAEMFPFELWHQPATYPAVQPSQIQNALYMNVSSGGFASGGGFDARGLFRGFDLRYERLIVPAHASLTVQMMFYAGGRVHHGRTQIDFESGDRAVISPGVLLTVSALA